MAASQLPTRSAVKLLEAHYHVRHPKTTQLHRTPGLLATSPTCGTFLMRFVFLGSRKFGCYIFPSAGLRRSGDCSARTVGGRLEMTSLPGTS